MPTRLLTDEQMDVAVVNELRRHGHDVVTVRQLCSDKYGDGFPDESVLLQALAEKRVVITDNRSDFRALHKTMPWHSGIVLCRVYDDAVKKAERISEVLRRRSAVTRFPHFTGQLMLIPPESAAMPDEDPSQT